MAGRPNVDHALAEAAETNQSVRFRHHGRPRRGTTFWAFPDGRVENVEGYSAWELFDGGCFDGR